MPSEAFPQTSSPGTPADISARLERLPLKGPVLRLVAMLSLGCFFENYFLQVTAYIAPSLVSDGIYNKSATSFFDVHSIGFFILSGFAGMAIGSVLFGFVADRFGRRPTFVWAMLWYASASLMMAFQSSSIAVDAWRFVSSIGLGLELVVVNTMVSELVSSRYRGRAVTIYQFISLAAAPIVALMSLQLSPLSPFHISGWRWVIGIGAASVSLAWWFRRRLPESPRWLAAVGRDADADRTLRTLENEVAARGVYLPPVIPTVSMPSDKRPITDLFRPPYRRRTIMFIIQQLFMPIGFYGFSSWIPTLLIAKGIGVTQSLFYAFLIAFATPASPLLMWFFADRIDRKQQIAIGGLASALLMFGFAVQTNPILIVCFGLAVTFSKSIIITAIANYMPECYPTAIRGAGHGLVYGVSRVMAALSGPTIAYVLAARGQRAVGALIGSSFIVVAVVTLALGPRVLGKTLEEINPASPQH